MTTKPRVTITGVSGYIGSQVCNTFLEHGGFVVRGTVRDKANEEKIEPLRKGFGHELFEQLELVEADLLDEDSIIAACEDSEYIVHTASPVFDIRAKYEDEEEKRLIKTAVDGTLAAMRAAQKYKVKKVVITGSIASITSRDDITTAGVDPNHLRFTEDDWTDVESEETATYAKTKTLAEKTAWNFVEKLPEDERFDVVTILPAVVFGPNISTSPSQSLDSVKKMMLGEYPMYPRIVMPFVDVRDVSRAHLEAVLRDEANGKRFILCAECPFLVEFAQSLHNKFSDNYPVNTKEMSIWLPFVVRLWDKRMSSMFKQWGTEFTYDGSRATQILGIEYIRHKQSLSDMGMTMIETGYIEDRRPIPWS